jgi:hypothetical protein
VDLRVQEPGDLIPRLRRHRRRTRHDLVLLGFRGRFC